MSIVLLKSLALAAFALCSIFAPAISSAAEKTSLVYIVERVANSLDARAGFSAYDLESGQRWEYQADERFAMSSTFKTLACAALLHRVDGGTERLDRALHFPASDLVMYSPVTGQNAGRAAMTLGELCAAALTVSDNTAANLILDALGGPASVTAFVRMLGDDVTRLDRRETELNEAAPGDPRDTSTPHAMVQNLQNLLFGEVLSAESRAQLRQWLESNQVADALFRASVPADWIVADRTGAGGFGSRSITAVLWPPGRQAVIVALYLAETPASLSESNAAIAEIGAAIVEAVTSGP